MKGLIKVIQVTELVKQILKMMREAGLEEEACMTSMTNLKTEEQQKKMLEFLKEHPTATNRQVILKTKEIIENRK